MGQRGLGGKSPACAMVMIRFPAMVMRTVLMMVLMTITMKLMTMRMMMMMMMSAVMTKPKAALHLATQVGLGGTSHPLLHNR